MKNTLQKNKWTVNEFEPFTWCTIHHELLIDSIMLINDLIE